GNSFFLCFDPDNTGPEVDGFPRIQVSLGGLLPTRTDQSEGMFIVGTSANER
ncbi:unnamed protein product, partial [Amoebophrya sp. A25]